MNDSADPPAIRAEGVSKRYGSFTAVDRLDLDVRRGEVFCLLGPNGSGKTTFLRMLAGYLSPSAGILTVAGHDIVRDGLAAKRKIGYAPESVPLYGHMRGCARCRPMRPGRRCGARPNCWRSATC